MTREYPNRTAARAARPLPLLLLAVSGALLLVGCALEPSREASSAQRTASPTSRMATDVAADLDTLDQLAPGDVERQAKALSDAMAAMVQAPTASNRLRYAIALGAAGRPDSNPVEARRLIAELLAGPNDLKPHEVSLAQAMLREFDARVALYAELARQRDETQQKLHALQQDAGQNADALAAENARLKKALADAERKLEAVAEMERSLLDQAKPKR